MFRFLAPAFFIFSFSSCHILDKSFSSRKTASAPVHPFEFKTVQTDWLKAHPEVYKELEKIIEVEKADIESQAKEYQKSFPNSRILPFKLSVENLIEFNKQDPNIVSVKAEFYTFTGGAHGMAYHISWNWDKKEKRFLSLSDYIKTEAELKNFKSKVKTALLKKIDPSFKDESWIEQGLSELQYIKSWNIDEDHIILSFAPYQLAPYAAGSIQVSAPKP